MRLNRKGFSLAELMVVIAVLVILISFVAPSAVSMVAASHKKADAATIANLEATLCAAVQNAEIYKEAQDIITNTVDKTITFVYIPKNNILTFNHCVIMDTTYTPVYGPAIGDDSNTSDELTHFANVVVDYINSHIEPIVLQSSYYKDRECKIVIQLSDLDFIVNSTVIVE